MTINIRQKGAGGERDMCKILNDIIMRVLRESGYDEETVKSAETTVQRNQNQTAVGGCDLVGTFQLAIEIKRQEALAVNTWWKQCETSAKKIGPGAIPVLLYRQNRAAWRCVMPGAMTLPSGVLVCTRVEVPFDDFLVYFEKLTRENVK